MREELATTVFILAWLAASAVWYFWLSTTLAGLLVGLVVLAGFALYWLRETLR